MTDEQFFWETGRRLGWDMRKDSKWHTDQVLSGQTFTTYLGSVVVVCFLGKDMRKVSFGAHGQADNPAHFLESLRFLYEESK